jgi:carbon-monoxide dehydrogenase iron sulfur subunit
VSAAGRLVIRPERCRGCRSCQLACSFARTGEYNPSRSCVELDRDLHTEGTAPMIRPLCCDLCNGRPACADACTYGAIMYEPNGEQEILYRRGRVVELE